MSDAPPFVAHQDKADDPSYVPSFRIGERDLGERQRQAVEAVQDLPGWLREEDALKLYELAWFSSGPILEIGTYRGKSAVLMARALREAGRPGPIVSLDVDRDALRAAAALAADRELADRIALVRGTAEQLFRSVPGLRPALVFLDGDHSRSGVARDLRALEPRVPAGGLLLFHDYHDARNADVSEPDYGVVQGVEESWVPRQCEFAGVFGCCGLFRRRTGPSGALEVGELPRPAQITDLGREPLASWFARRVVGGTARRVARLR
jgi:predicted O-methyltransferase YrrM